MSDLATITRPTVAELLQHAQQQLISIDTARLDAELLLCHAARLPRTTLHAHPELMLDENVVHAFQYLVEQRHAEVPIAYITGKKEFWSMEFKVNEHTLIPRPETECLVDTALTHIPVNKKYKIADLGTGCGNIAISIARERPDSHIIAIDISSEALNLAEENAKQHGVTNISFIESDWFNHINDNFDMIVSNPPYIKIDDEHLVQGDVQHEPRIALESGIVGLDSITHIIINSCEHLADNAYLILEHGFDQGSMVRALLEEYGFTESGTLKDTSGHERISFGKYKN